MSKILYIFYDIKSYIKNYLKLYALSNELPRLVKVVIPSPYEVSLQIGSLSTEKLGVFPNSRSCQGNELVKR